MGLIPKTVLTPAKWVFKKVLNRTLLTFPASEPITVKCVYCPEMCRFSCPTAVVAANDAVTPCNKMGSLYKEEKWPGRQGVLWNIYDCTGCGRCTEFCVHDQPVMQTLFEARAAQPWERARAVAAALSDSEDVCGDLADELGDRETALRRASAFAKGKGVCEVEEPRQVYFLGLNGHSAALSWQQFGTREAARVVAKLGEKRWLYHESSWFNRNLGRADESQGWSRAVTAAGASLVMPFHHGRDCIDCGGEGAYPKLFAEQARAMAKEFWERDKDRADGILCVSARCARHLREATGVEVMSLAEILR